ncbi:hypothetical protein F8388_016095 [Cannabis sativa]|uniref:DUF8039 domain-containing protein n=1 Tax=Cannabis sativa TaxID=3483 RepID=A0A7J6FUV1_CANSA|nr:hypothetical protein F8388_016095 [Cannabis sativa]
MELLSELENVEHDNDYIVGEHLNWIKTTYPSAFIMDNPPSDDGYDQWGEAVGLDDDHTDAFGDMVDGPTEVGTRKKNVRGACVNKVLQKYRAEGKKMEVEYNMWGQPINESGDIQVSTIGAYVRRNIPLKVHLIFGGETRASALRTAGELLKSWRTKLTSQLIYKYKDEAPEHLEDPPKHYLSCYDEKQWKSFVASRLTPEWEKKRAKAQAIRAKNIYNHRTGRGGAKKVETEMEKELGHQLTEFDRSGIWMRMHTNKKGEIEGPAKEKLKCNLHVEDRSMNKPPLVATGHVVIQPKLEKLRVDGKEYGDTYSCVFIEKIIKHNALLPQLLEQQGFRTVGEAIGCYVAWPRAYTVLEKSNQETAINVRSLELFDLPINIAKSNFGIITLIPCTYLTKSIYFWMNGRNSFSSSSLNQRNIEALELFCVGHALVIKSYNIDGKFDKL